MQGGWQRQPPVTEGSATLMAPASGQITLAQGSTLAQTPTLTAGVLAPQLTPPDVNMHFPERQSESWTQQPMRLEQDDVHKLVLEEANARSHHPNPSFHAAYWRG